jgi:homoserine O-succinyltransferase
LEEIENQKFDGMIITGAPVETLHFEEVDYWKELSELMNYTRSNVFSTMHICWGAQAGLYYHYGVDKYTLDKKLFGVFPHVVRQKNCELLRGFDDEFYVPHSRYAQIDLGQLSQAKEVLVLADSEEAGPHILATPNARRIFVQGHMEYEEDTLKLEYERDIHKGINIDVPKNYFKNDNPAEGIIVRWRGHGNLFYSNWLNFIYQGTPYAMENLETY